MDGGLDEKRRKEKKMKVIFEENMEEDMEDVKDEGGDVVKKILKFKGGRSFKFKDKDGKEIEVWRDK